MMQAVVTSCVLLCALATLGAIASVCFAALSEHSTWKDRIGLIVGVLAVAPSLVFATSGIYRAERERVLPWHANVQTLLDVAIVWLFVGPVLLLASAGVAKPREAGRINNGLRMMLALGWIAASFMTVEACVHT